MEISVSQEQGRVPVTVFDIRGEITADTAARFREEAERAMAGGAQNLVLDLTNVPYIGSFGLRALNDILKGLHKGASDQNEAQLRQALRDGRSKSAHLKLVNPNPQVMKVLETTGFDMFLEVYPTVKTAVASF
jgi:anti-anti-sigma factor